MTLLSHLANFVDILAGITPVMYHGEPVLLYDFFFMMTPITAVLWGITAIGMALALGFSILVVTQKAADLKVEKTMGMVLGQIARTFAMFLITPILMVVLLQLTSVIMRQTDQLFDIASNSAGIDHAIFALTAAEAVKEDSGVIARFASGALDYNNYYHVSWNLLVDEIRMWIGIPLTVSLILVYFSMLMVFALRVFNLLLLYAVSPLFVSSIVLDDGEKYKLWRSAFLGKLFLGYSMILSVKVVTYILIPFITSDFALAPNPGGDVVMKAIFMFGALYGAYKTAGVIPKLISPNFGGDDDSMMMGMTSAMVMSAGKKSLSMGIHAAGEVAKAGVNAAKFVAKMVVKIVIAVVKTIFLGDVSAIGRAVLSVIKDTIKAIVNKIKEIVKKIIKTIVDIIDTIMSLLLKESGIDSTGGHDMGVFTNDGGEDGESGGEKKKIEESGKDGNKDGNKDEKDDDKTTGSNKEGEDKKETGNKEGNKAKKTGNKEGEVIKTTGNKESGVTKTTGNKEGTITNVTGNKEKQSSK